MPRHSAPTGAMTSGPRNMNPHRGSRYETESRQKQSGEDRIELPPARTGSELSKAIAPATPRAR